MLWVVVAVLAVVLLWVQLASDALYSGKGTTGSLPSRLVPAWGDRAYRRMERVAPAAFVEAMLVRRALLRGDLTAAQRHAVLMPSSSTRNELLARVAQARGDETLAQEYYLVAPDVDAVQREVTSLAKRDPVAAFNLEMRLKNRLEALTVHPDAVAEAYWRLGELSTLRGYLHPPIRDGMFRRGMRFYRRAAALAPLSEKYLLAAGIQALSLHLWTEAATYFQRGVDVDPIGASSLAGLGIVALHRGDLAAARRYAARAQALNPHAHMLANLEHALP